MTDAYSALDERVQKQETVFLDELRQLLRIPSVSTLPAHRPDMERAVEFVMEKLRAAGMEHVERIVVDQGHPLIYADWLHAPGAPTVLCYGHYDVQPPDPLEEWVSPPFEPVVRQGNLYARGAADDKGQFYTHLKAVQILMQQLDKLPINVKFLIEGEEEVGGEAVDKFVRQQHAKLACDCALVSDTAMYAPGMPSLDVGLRGMVYTEVEVLGAQRDLHSGLYGGIAPNPFDALVRIIAGLKGADGKILIPGFYDKVQAPSAVEKSDWSRLPFNEADFLAKEMRAPALVGESGYSVFERTWARPTLDVHGIAGGFTGPGSKTVMPARAVAKVSMRLVPDQTPGEIQQLFTAAVEKLTPKGYSSRVRVLNVADPVMVKLDNRFIRTAASSLHRVFSAEPVYIRSGGSIPIVALFASELQAPTVMMGFGLPDDGLHSPNEKFALSSFYNGIRAVADFLLRLSKT